MRRVLAGLVTGWMLMGVTVGAQAPDRRLVDQGRRLFASEKCDKCHMIAGRGTKKGPLDGVASKLSVADIRKWLTTPAEMEAKLEKPPTGTDSMANALKTKGLQPAEIDQLVAYLSTLTKK
jgi:mono/diheme cytochrome c family protein